MSLGWKGVGYILYIAVYFNYLNAYYAWPAASLTTAILKSLPILHLVFSVMASYSESSTTDSEKSPTITYRFWIGCGLIFSAFGDISLVWRDDYFQLGAVMFGLAHVFYIKAFGLTPFGSRPTFASFVVLMAAMYSVVTSEMKDNSPMKVVFLAYATLIFTMAWRSFVQYRVKRTFTSFVTCCGAIIFIVSDTMVAWDKEKGLFHLAPFWIMVTYYSAQLCIAYSAI